VCKTTLQIPSRSTQNEGERKKKEREEPSSPKKEEVGWGEVQEEKEKRDGKEGAEEKHPQNY